MSLREIGGDFHFNLAPGFRSRRDGTDILHNGAYTAHVASGRDALHHIIKTLGLADGERVLLPAYLCEDVVKPFLSHGLKVEFYSVGPDLQIDGEDLLGKLSEETRVLLYIHYFGFQFELPPSLLAQVNPRTTVIEDASHSFLSNISQQAVRPDVMFASYRKLLPIPNGAAITWMGKPTPARTHLSLPYLGSLSCRCAGATLKGFWLRRPGFYPKGVFRRLFAWSERLLDAYPKPAGMSLISKYLLDRVDLDEVVRVRRRNFQILLNGLNGSADPRPMYADLPEGICPLGFPVLSEDRDALARHLIDHKIFPPVHWELPDSVDREEFGPAWYVSDHILTIPIDQRYDKEDMARILQAISDYRPAEAASYAGR